jgi:hypothetical protein
MLWLCSLLVEAFLMRSLFLAAVLLLLAITPLRAAVDKTAIGTAVERGVKALVKLQRANGTWPHEQIGATALAGLTLLECGKPSNDKAVEAAAKAVRIAGLRLDSTYSLSLCILFLDRLDKAEDTPLIESMIVRLLAGQDAGGGWTYECPSIGEGEVRRLSAEMTGRVLRGTRDLTKLPAKGKRTTADLAKEIQAQLKQIGAVARPVPRTSDNSNTQFATLALWVGRRYGVPTQAALLRVEQRFRASQAAGGEWGYFPPMPGMPLMVMPESPGLDQRATMTCSGLLGVACGLGAKTEIKKTRNIKASIDVSKDKSLQAGLEVLSTVIGKPFGGSGKDVRPGFPAATGKVYYFLWSLERVAVIFDLATIGKKDWYSWGAELALANQKRDGSWAGEYGPSGVDTCFALLFLKKVNLTRDLTSRLTGKKDLGDKILKTGDAAGIGTEQTAARLARDLLRARESARAGILEALRDRKGAAYTEALAAVIPKLEGQARRQAREALADRLTRMKPATLREYFKEKDVEIRRAAALAAGQKDARSLVPDLIRLLEDETDLVRRAAHASLKAMAGKDLGPKDGSESERKKAIAAWQAWWKKTRE